MKLVFALVFLVLAIVSIVLFIYGMDTNHTIAWPITGMIVFGVAYVYNFVSWLTGRGL